MSIRKLISVGICFCMALSGYAQSFTKFDSLKQKAYKAYDNKNYKQSTFLFDQALQLSSNQKPQEVDIPYYDIACSYSLSMEKEKALAFLEKSFLILSKQNRTPVPA